LLKHKETLVLRKELKKTHPLVVMSLAVTAITGDHWRVGPRHITGAVIFAA